MIAALHTEDARVHDRPRVRRWLLFVLAGVFVSIAAVGAAVSVLDRGPSRLGDQGRQRRELVAYGKAIAPVVDAGGQVVALGLKPGIADIVNHSYPPEVLTSMASAWVAQLKALRTDLKKVERPKFLAEAHWLYEQSLEGYVNTAIALRAAIAAGDETRQADLVDLAASLGSAADRLFDHAQKTLDQYRARLGLPDKD